MRRRTRVLLAFLGTIAIVVGSLLLFIQSKYFAIVLKDVARKYMPTDFGIEGEFSELAVKLIPPGVVIKNPAITLKKKNPAHLPAGTKIDAQSIDVTFQLFQILTGAVTVNAFAIHGATLKLDLDENFFAAHERQQKSRNLLPSKFSWDELVRFDFRSVSLVDSQVDIRISRATENNVPVHVQAFAKELTIGRATINNVPTYDLAVDLQRASFEVGKQKYSLAQYQASVELSAAGAQIRNMGIQEGELNFHTNGVVRGDLLNPKSLKSEISYIVRGPIPAWLDPNLAGKFISLPKSMSTEGLLTVEGHMTGDLKNLEKTLETKVLVQLEKARVGEWRAEKAQIKGTWKAPVAMLESAEIDLGDGKVRVGKMTYDHSDRRRPVKVALELENADFRKLLGSEVNSVYPLHMILTGTAEAEVVPMQQFSMSGGVDLRVQKFSFDNQKPGVVKPLSVLLAIDDLALKGRFEVDNQGVRFDRTELTLPHSKLTASGRANDRDGFDIDIKGKVNLEDVGKLSKFDIRGEGDLHWTIKGRKPDVVFTFDAELKKGKYLNLDLGDVKGRLVYNDGNDMLYFENLVAQQGRSHFVANGTINVGKTDEASMNVQVTKGTVQDFTTIFAHFIKESVPWYPYELTGHMAGLIRVSGKTDMDKLSVEGDMELGNVEYRHEIFHQARMHAGYRRGAYIAENIFIRKKNGQIRGNLVFDDIGGLKFDFKSDGLSTLDIDHFAAWGIPYRAPILLETQGAGKFGSLKSKFHLAFGDGMIRNLAVPRTDFAFSTEGGRIHGDMSVFGGQVKGRMDVGWERGSSSSFDIDARHFDFKPILVGLNPSGAEDPELHSELTGSAHLRFVTGALSRLSGNVGLSKYVLRRKGYNLQLGKPVDIEIQNGNYSFAGATLVGDGSSLTASGHVREGAINYNIGGTLNLGLFSFLTPEVASVLGNGAKVTARVFGRADAPNFHADIEARDLDLRLRAIEQPFENMGFNVKWDDAHLVVTDIKSTFAGGLVRGDGDIRLHLDKVPDLDFRVDLENPKVKVFPVAYARTSGRLSLSGTELPYKVKGNLHVGEALINENFNLSEGSRALRSSKFLPQKGGATGEVQVFDLDVDIAGERGILVRNDLFDAEIKGNIKIINSVQTPRVLGQASVLHGRLLFKDNFFTIQSGEIAFKNPAALDPEFSLSGQTEVKGYKVFVVAAGLVSDYKLTFQSQPPLSQNDIVSLLTLGVTSSGFQSIARENRDAYSRDEMYGLLFSQSGVNKSLQKSLGVKVRVDQSQSLVPENAFRARGPNDVSETIAPKVVVQKEVTKNLNASLGSTVGIGGSTERNIDLEYDFAKHWSVLGKYEDQRGLQPSQTRTSVGADLKFKLRFK